MKQTLRTNVNKTLGTTRDILDFYEKKCEGILLL